MSEHTCGCGCEGEHTHEEGYYNSIILTMDDDTEVSCTIIDVLPLEDKQYIALLPDEPVEGFDDGDILLYRFHEEDGEPVLENIESDEEYEAVADLFDDYFEEYAEDEEDEEE